MLINDFCINQDMMAKRRLNFKQRKLELLKLYKDSLERRIAAMNASIDVLQSQIDRDSN